MGRASGLLLFGLAYAVLLEVMLAAAILFWPEFSANVTTIGSMARALPIMGDMVSAIEEEGFQAYVLVQHFFKACSTLGTAAAVLFAAPAVAGEVHRGTLELLLARPVSRDRLLLERWLAGALALVLPVFVTTLTIPALGARVDELEPYGPYLACAAHQSLFLLALYGVTFLASAAFSNPNKIALTCLFLVVFQFALYMVKTVTHYSLFRMCDLFVLRDLAQEGRWNLPIAGTLAATVAVSLAASLAVFRRRCP